MHIQVLGAGCFGLSAALALARRGHDVTVVDPRGVGAGATGKAAGIVSTMAWNDDDFHLIQQTRGALGMLIAEASMEDLPEARLWGAHDSLTIADADRLDGLDALQHRLERLGEEPERLDAAALRDAYPLLRIEDDEEALLAQEDGTVEAGDLATLLAWACKEEDVTISTAAGDAEGTVVAAGAWTPSLLEGHGAVLPLASFRTQLASIETDGGVPIVHDVAQGFYIRPESAGSILAGDGTVLEPHDPDAYDEAADPAFCDHIAARLVRRLQGGEEARWRTGWAGLCVGTPDRRPVCGAVPEQDGLWVLSGDNGYGVMRCLALGERLADAVDGDEAEATAPSRFAGHSGPWRLREGFAW